MNDQYVRIKKSELDKFIEEAAQVVSDSKCLASMLEATWKSRIDLLADEALSVETKRSTLRYEMGMLRAWAIMTGQTDEQS